MPERDIHSRSFLIPSFVMFPFIQCHHTRGLALLGGVVKLLYKTSPELFACEKEMTDTSRKTKSKRFFLIMASLY
jgi:hypothetical protein